MGGQTGVEGDLTGGGEYTVPYIDDVLNCAPETSTSIILLTNANPINSIKRI